MAMVAGGAADAADATTILDGTGTDNDSPPTRKRPLYHHMNRICMPLIEWACVAGIPNLLCIKIVGIISSKNWTKFLSVEATIYKVWPTSKMCGGVEIVYWLQWMLPAMVITSFLSLITIILFGDSHCHGNGHPKSRNMGIVVGSHLIPLLYLALQLSALCGDAIDSDSSSCTSWESNQTKSDSFSVEGEDYETHIPISGRELNHLKFASLGGLAFVLSCTWAQYNHRKYNSERLEEEIFEGQTGDSFNSDGVNKGEDTQPKYSATEAVMSICWKIYSLLVIFQSTIHALSYDYDVCTLLLEMLHLLLIRVYDQKTAKLTQDSQTIQGAWQDAFTPGEWMAVSTLITSLVGEYVLEYSGIMCNSKAGDLAFYSPLPLHLTVAHAGVVGCLVGVIIWSFLKSLLNSIFYQGTDVVRNNVTRKIGMVVSLVPVAGITCGCLEVALNSRLDDSDAYSAKECICSDFNLPTLCVYIPQSVQWLFHFLSSKLIISLHGSTIVVFRLVLLGYWACILAVCLPGASMLTSWIADGNENSIVDSNMSNGAGHDWIQNHNKKQRKKRVIIARKYFHVVAILLFTPITWLDADVMALSYAIATALLIVLEMIRGWIFTHDKNPKIGAVRRNTGGTSWSQFYMLFLDEKDSSAAKGGPAVTHIALIVGCAFPLWVNQILQQTYSATDTLSLQSPPGTLFNSDEILLTILPFLGVLVLGIGDSAGAVWGMKFGRYCWPGGSSRTLEGSLCMYLSMMLVIFGASFFIASTNNVKYQHNNDIANYAIHCIVQASLPLGMITLIEASTAQIDNLILPIAGSTLVLLMTVVVQ